MFRSRALPLTLALLSLVVAVTLQGQGRQGGGRGQVELPEGAGKEVVSASCASCHGLNMITGAAGYTQDGWRDLISTMIELPAGADGNGVAIPGHALPAETRARAHARSGQRVCHVP